ncbi:MAG: hypothetical protein JOY90_33940 [Bradyrhizobium sp.]|uniref:hypothetical protein n=1 Tax=Bradyrhizobium sp. TaxID=376 RepID=UPI001DAE6DDF|nr:hypothetical protein [Bradyrhizobium sp.]MBV9565417.1 hypothetical protein [Bradyrhizobium sp.]
MQDGDGTEGAGAAGAVLASSAVEALGASPGNCTAVCGFTEELLDGPAAPMLVAPDRVEPGSPCVRVGTLKGSQPVDTAHGFVEEPTAPKFISVELAAVVLDDEELFDGVAGATGLPEMGLSSTLAAELAEVELELPAWACTAPAAASRIPIARI